MKRTPSLLLILLLFVGNTTISAQTEQLQKVKAYLQSDLKLQDPGVSYKIKDHYTSKNMGVTHIYVRQTFKGVEVHGANIGIHLSSENRLLTKNGKFIRNLADRIQSTTPTLSPIEAVQIVATAKNYTLQSPLKVLEAKNDVAQTTLVSHSGISTRDIPVKLMYQPMNNGEVKLAWDFSIEEVSGENYGSFRVDARTGAFLDRTNWTHFCDFGEPEGTTSHTGCTHANTPEATTNTPPLITETENYSKTLEAPILTNSFSGNGGNILAPDTYEVLALPIESSNFGVRTQEVNPQLNNTVASPWGWHQVGGAGTPSECTEGNNVDAYEDTDQSDSPTNGDGSRACGGPLLEFIFPYTPGTNPSMFLDAAITNAFYWGNMFHDIMYNYGFDEASGNFQEDNNGNGGMAADRMLLEVQDGSGTCNANTTTPPDGTSGRTQLFICGNNDGAFDNGVTIHELAHGLSNRLTGGPANSDCLNNSEQMGEGWSDWYALMFTMETGDQETDLRTVGTWLLEQGPNGPGVRNLPYTTDMTVNSLTYGDVGAAFTAQDVGEVWSTMLWELTWDLIDQYGFDTDFYGGAGGNNLALQLVTDAMKLQPCSPGFVDARDAILLADTISTGGTNACFIWNAFAKRGLGFSATQGDTDLVGDETEAFDLPANCVIDITKTADVQTIGVGGTITYSILVENMTGSTLTGVEVTDELPPNTIYVPGSANNGGMLAGGVVGFPALTLAPAEVITHTFQVTIDPGVILPPPDFFDDMESGAGNWNTISTQPSVSEWILTNTNPNSPTISWFASNTPSTTEQFLLFADAVGLTDTSLLEFTHDFDVETFFDGGFVEISTDCGITWQDLGPFMIQNGYNSFVGADPAFSGSSGTYITTIVDLGSFAGTSAQIRFRLFSDIITGVDGWYIDDVSLTNLDVKIPNKATVTTNEGLKATAALATPTCVVLPDFILDVTPSFESVCAPADGTFTANIDVQGGFTGDVTLAANNLPAGVTATFSTNPVTTPGMSTLTIGNTAGVMPGFYDIEVTGTGSTGIKMDTVEILIADAVPIPPTLLLPIDGATLVPLQPTLSWAEAPLSENYFVEISDDVNFNNIVESALLIDTFYTLTTILNSNTTYYWHAVADNGCGVGNFSTPFSFTTYNETCITLANSNIDSISAVPDTVISTIIIPDDGVILDVNVLNLDIGHTFTGDLEIRLTSPEGTTITLIDQICGASDSLFLSLDDQSPNLHSAIPCPATDGLTYQPDNFFSAFNNENPSGTWTLTVIDFATGDGGALKNWELDICYYSLVDFSLTVTPEIIEICAPSDATFTVDIGAFNNFSENVTLGVNNLPAGATATFTNNPVMSPGMSTLTIGNTAGIMPATYNIEITASASTGTKSQTVELLLDNAPPSTFVLMNPVDMGIGAPLQPTFNWGVSSFANSYIIEIADDMAFANIIETGMTIQNTYNLVTELSLNTLYYWRVTAVNACGSTVSTTFSFTTISPDCMTYTSSNVPVAVGPNPSTVTSTIDIPETGTITDVNIQGLDITHTWVGDLEIRLTSPEGTTVLVSDNTCTSEDDMLISFDDDSPNPHSAIPCPPTDGLAYQPLNALSAFNGENLAGVWTLTITDVATGDGGTLNAWDLEVCYIADYDLRIQPSSLAVCSPNDAVFTVGVSSLNNFSGDVTLSAMNLPIGATATFSTNPVTAPGLSTLTIGNIGAFMPGTYTFDVQGIGVTGIKIESGEFILHNALPGQANLLTPADNATGLGVSPEFIWDPVADALSYTIEIATDDGFVNIIESATIETEAYTLNSVLLPFTTYYWRVTAENGCGGTTSTTFTFKTANEACETYISQDVPVDIISLTTATSTITIGESAPILDVDVVGIDITHTWVGDLIISLESPEGTIVTLIDGTCTDEDNMDISFDDQASNLHGDIPCPPTDGDFYQPFDALSAFNGENLNGVWTLSVEDIFTPDDGTLNAWGLSICFDGLGVMITSTDVNCNGDADGTATAMASGGESPYTYAWSNMETTATITGLAPATYVVTVTDNAGITATASVTINEPPALSLATAPTHTTCGQNNGEATATPAGGTPPYTYAWSNMETTATISNLAAGTYDVIVTDANQCTAEASITINGSQGINLTFSETATTCGLNNGEAMVTAADGLPPYIYLWSNMETTATISNLAPGTYDVTVTDANQCTATGTATIGGSSPLSTTTSQMDVTCNGGNDGSATVIPNGGSGMSSYLWNNMETTATITGLTAGIYNVTVTDDNIAGCTSTASVTILEPNPLIVEISSMNTYCNMNNGSATALSAGGTPDYTYLWSNMETTATISDLAPGTYDVTVTDANQCTGTASVTIESSLPLGLTMSSTNITCNGEEDGTATATPSDGSGDYTYLWNTGEMTQTITDLDANTYDVIVIDNLTGCTASGIVTITEPDELLVTSVPGHTTCGLNNGTATAVSAGGTPDYTYLWSNMETTATIINLAAGTYDVTVTDANQCTATNSVTIQGSIALTLSTVGTDVTCNGGSDGEATVSVLGGSGTYTYLWSSGGTTATETGLTAGTYTVEVTDVNTNCTATDMVTINEPPAINITFNSTDTNCGQDNGSATAIPANGAPDYTYLWSNQETTATIANLAAGTYDVTVTDANQCTATNSVTIQGSIGLSLTFMTVEATCNGDNDGEATVSVSNGSGNYTYLWSSGGNTATETGLTAGTYTVDVTDQDSGCTATGMVTVNEPAPLTVPINAANATCGNNNGSATAMPMGGTADYTYLWNNQETTATISDLAPGTYSVVVTDANGCTASNMVSIIGTGSLSVSITSMDVSCNGENDGTATANVTSGSGDYSYAWNNQETTTTISDLAPGTYSVVVTDNISTCTGTADVTITEPMPLTVMMSATDTPCGQTNGTAMATPAGGTADYTYLWSNQETTATISNLGPGTYSVVVTDANGCTVSDMITVLGTGFLDVSINGTNVSCNGENDGSATATIASGSGDYSYAWNNQETTATIIDLTAGTYSVVITDNVSGCTGSDNIIITEPIVLTVAMSGTPTTCGALNGSATATPSGGTTDYTYLWSNQETTATISGLSNGTYDVTVTDANGCTATGSYLVNTSTAFSVMTTQTNINCFGGNEGEATAIPMGGSGDYSYLWSNQETTATISNLTAGMYSVVVTDNSNGCTETTDVTITEPAQLTISMIPGNTTCGQSNGTATAFPFGGTPTYSYLWGGGETTSTITGLAPGMYNVTVTDMNGCTAENSINIIGSIGLTLVSSENNVSCNGANDGSAAITSVQGGFGTYSYLWSNQATTAGITNISGGTYTVVVTDDFTGCTASETFTITEPPVLVLNVITTHTVCGGDNGTASATATGGTPNYTYNWSNGATTAAISNLASGTYTVTVTDVNGCTVTETVTINPSSSMPTSLTAASGVFSDGSGFDDYINNINCQWIIQPNNASVISLFFSSFNTEAGQDFVRVYDGSTTADPLLGEFSGTTIPASINSTGGTMLIVFTTNGSGVAPGWNAVYTSCIADLNISNDPIPLSLYEAGNSITSDGRVAPNSDVTFDSGNEILLDFGFQVDLGGVFEAVIDGGCNPD